MTAQTMEATANAAVMGYPAQECLSSALEPCSCRACLTTQSSAVYPVDILDLRDETLSEIGRPTLQQALSCRWFHSRHRPLAIEEAGAAWPSRDGMSETAEYPISGEPSQKKELWVVVTPRASKDRPSDEPLYSSMSTEDLVRTCAEDTTDPLAWEEFIRRYNRVIAGVVFRAARQWREESPEAIDDLVQETYLKLCVNECQLLRQFDLAHAGSIFGYLKAIAANVVHDRFHALHAEKRGGNRKFEDMDAAEAVTADGAFGSPGAIEHAILLEEINSCLQMHTSGPTGERDRMIFWLYYRQGLTARAIASMPLVDVSAKGVESTIFRLTRLIRMEMKDAAP